MRPAPTRRAVFRAIGLEPAVTALDIHAQFRIGHTDGQHIITVTEIEMQVFIGKTGLAVGRGFKIQTMGITVQIT